MNMDDIYEIAFELILHAGNSRSQSILAVREAENGNFEKTGEHMREAENELKLAHDIQTGLLSKEAEGDTQSISLLMVHAQDHLSMAMSQREMSSQIIRLYQRLENMK